MSSEPERNSPAHPEVLKVLQRDRAQCDGFVEWEPGYSPREHKEMLILERREKAERDWREKQSKIEHERRVEDQNRQHQWRKEDRSLALTNLGVTAAVAFLSTVVTLIAAKLLPWFSGAGS